MWDTVSCLRRQHNDRDWALNHQSLDLKSHVLTTSPPRPLLHVSEQQKKKNSLTSSVNNQTNCGGDFAVSLSAITLWICINKKSKQFSSVSKWETTQYTQLKL